MFMGNIHGQRLNMDVLKPKGSGYVASHGPDFLLANDAWARFINMRYGPDGNVYLIDWYDKQACHTATIRMSGTATMAGSTRSAIAARSRCSVDLTKKTRQGAGRAAAAQERLVRAPRPAAAAGARADARDTPDCEITTRWRRSLSSTRTRRGGCAACGRCTSTGGLTAERTAKRRLADDSRRTCGPGQSNLRWRSGEAAGIAVKTLAGLLGAAMTSPVVRLYLRLARCSGLPAEQRWDSPGTGWLPTREDADDHNLPLHVLVRRRAAGRRRCRHGRCSLAARRQGAARCCRSWSARDRLRSARPKRWTCSSKALGQGERCRPATSRSCAACRTASRAGGRSTMPPDWPDVFARAVAQSADAEVRSQAVGPGRDFGDPKAFAELARGPGLTRSRRSALRAGALAALLDARDKELPPVLHAAGRRAGTARRRHSRPGRLRRSENAGSDPRRLSSLDRRREARRAATRWPLAPAYGKALLERSPPRKCRPADVSAEIVRQLRNLNDKELDQRIAEVWGIVRTTPADRPKLIADYRSMLSQRPRCRA